MNIRLFRSSAASQIRCRLLISVLFLSLGSICVAGERIPASRPATDSFNTGDIGEPEDGRAKGKPVVENLGQGKYRIGKITIDKPKRLITVPGVMLPYEDGKAIEFLATTKHGYKSYESVLMLDVNAFEFNLACILIGLDSKHAVSPEYHFDPRPVKGDPVSIRIVWEVKDRVFEFNAVDLLNLEEGRTTGPAIWSYTGSIFDDSNRYLAQMDGVLIGLVHDPASIIEHRDGLGLGKLGAVTVNPDTAPRSGQVVRVTVQAMDSALSE